MISVIIPCKTKADLCPELLPALKNAPVIIVDDKNCPGSPAEKRDWAANRAKGDILAFIDSDAYPGKNWLKNAQKLLKPARISAVCGPGLTPPTDNWR
ncbi:MAG: glycosyltransferase, partial [Patescibacteria group bacterium]